MRQFKPLPPEMKLEQTLARRVGQLREFRNLTVRDLARLSRLTIQRIEDIEAGLETWLSSTDRQKLAGALSVEPRLIQESESRPSLDISGTRHDIEARIAESVLDGARELECPQCGGVLRCSIQDAYDLHGNPTQFAKAFCLKCPFVLK
jgi:transcriptional regulator with XRE-family HTH domain